MARSVSFAVLLALAGFASLNAVSSGYYNRVMFMRSGKCGAGSVARVQAVPSGNTTATTVSGASKSQSLTQTAGNLLVAVAFGKTEVDTTFSVSDTLGNTWYPLKPQIGENAYSKIQMFFAPNIAGGANTVTVTQALAESGAYTGLAVVEYSGLPTSEPVDISAGKISDWSSTTSASTGSMTLAATGCPELVVSAFGDLNIPFTSAGSGWTSVMNDSSATMIVQDSLPTLKASGSTFDPSAPFQYSSTQWVASAVAFRLAGSPVPSQPTKLAFTSGAQTLARTWQCSSGVTLQAQNASNAAVRVSQQMHIALTGNGLNFFSDSQCLKPITAIDIYAGLTTSAAFYFSSSLSGTRALTATGTGMSAAAQNEIISATEPYIWAGGVGCAVPSWNNALCWSGGAVPSNSTVAHFDGNCTLNCSPILTSNTNVGGVVMHPGYAGTINMAGYGLTLAGEARIASGTLNAGSGILNVQGNFRILGGSFSSSGNVMVKENFEFASGSANWTGSTLTFYDNVSCNPSYTVRPGTANYGDVRFADDTVCDSIYRNFFGPGEMNVLGTLTVGSVSRTSRLHNRAINARGDVVFQNLGYIGHSNPTIIRVAGSGNQTIYSTSATSFAPALEFASTGGTVTINGDLLVAGNYEHKSGMIDFASNNATLVFNDPYICNGQLQVRPGSAVYNHVKFADAANCSWVVRGFTPGSTMDIRGNLTLASVGQTSYLGGGGSLLVKGNLYVRDVGYFKWGNATGIQLTGVNQLLDASTATQAYLPTVEIASSGTVTVKGTPRIGGDYRYVSGNVDFTTHNATLAFDDPSVCPVNADIVPGNITYNNVSFVDTSYCGGYRSIVGSPMAIAGTTTIGTQPSGGSVMDLFGQLNISGALSFIDQGYWGNAEITLVGSNSQTITGSPGSQAPYGTLTINKPGGVLNLASGFSMANGQLVRIQAGTVNMNGHSVSIPYILNMSAGTVLNRGGGVLTTGTLINNGTINP